LKNESKQSGPKSEYLLNQPRSGALLQDLVADLLYCLPGGYNPVASTNCVHHRSSVSVEKTKTKSESDVNQEAKRKKTDKDFKNHT
jgi:hypothetical protein